MDRVLTPATVNGTFKARSDFRLNVCVGTNGGPYDFGDYAFGYHKALERLFQSLNEDRTYADVVFYPVAYLYRHAVELYLKDALSTWLAIGNEATAVNGHDLAKLFSDLRSLCGAEPEMKEANWEALDRQIRDLQELDRGAETFRYPILKDSSPTVKGWGIYNIEALAEVALNCLAELEQLCGYSKYLYEQKMECLHDYM